MAKNVGKKQIEWDCRQNVYKIYCNKILKERCKRKKDSKMKVENYEDNKELKKKKEGEAQKYKHVDLYCNNR